MSYKTILVHLNDERRLPSLLAAAVQIAQASSAHLIGLAVLPPIIIVPGTDAGPGVVIDEHRITYQAQINRMRVAFDALQGEPGFTTEWRELDGQDVNPFGDVAMVVLGSARAADLVITGQANPEWALSGYLDVAEQLILESGRPVLLMPKAGPARSSLADCSGASANAIGKRILLAWNGRREAVRAVFDALPLLKAADVVKVGCVDPQAEGTGAGMPPSAQICNALARHGVKCEAMQPIHAKRGVGSALLATADSERADMLVMGCYGRSRLREFIMGGASQHVLGHMNIPVLMSH